MEPEPPPIHIFVYGTLRRSEALPMHQLLLPATFVGVGSFAGRLYDVGAYPAAVRSDDPAERVHGEVYRLHEPATTLARLDTYEGCTDDDPVPHEYVRTTLDVQTAVGSKISALVYLYNHPTTSLTRVPGGDYLRWIARGRTAESNRANNYI